MRIGRSWKRGWIPVQCELVRTGAGDGIRTRDIDLGKVALYQLSYSRAKKSLRHSPTTLLQMSIHVLATMMLSRKGYVNVACRRGEFSMESI